MDMIERIASMLAKRNNSQHPEAFHGIARAVIEEMRIPTDDMLDKMNDVWVDAGEVSINVCFADLKEIYAAAIDAALKEHEGAKG